MQWLKPELVEATVDFEQPMAQLVQLSPLRCWLKLMLTQLLPVHFYFLQEEVPLSLGHGLLRPGTSVVGHDFAIAT